MASTTSPAYPSTGVSLRLPQLDQAPSMARTLSRPRCFSQVLYRMVRCYPGWSSKTDFVVPARAISVRQRQIPVSIQDGQRREHVRLLHFEHHCRQISSATSASAETTLSPSTSRWSAPWGNVVFPDSVVNCCAFQAENPPSSQLV